MFLKFSFNLLDTDNTKKVYYLSFSMDNLIRFFFYSLDAGNIFNFEFLKKKYLNAKSILLFYLLDNH